MNRLSIPVLVLSLFLAQSAAAQSEEGPFLSRQHLVNYWSANASGSHAIHVFLNMYKVYDHFGFGPALGKTYYQCTDGLIRKNCNSFQGPFTWSSDAVSFVNSLVGAPNNTPIVLDGAYLQQGFGPYAGYFTYKTCYGQSYNGNLLTYVVLVQGYAYGASYSGISCLPAP